MIRWIREEAAVLAQVRGCWGLSRGALWQTGGAAVRLEAPSGGKGGILQGAVSVTERVRCRETGTSPSEGVWGPSPHALRGTFLTFHLSLLTGKA